jgi:hypothetical protein
LNFYKKIRIKFKNVGTIGFTVWAIKCFVNIIFWNLKYPFRQLEQYLFYKKDIEIIFQTIYDKNLWSSTESKSGRGSEILYTENLRLWLEKNISNYDIKNIVDSPCGDFNWMRYVLQHVSADYLGIDIVEKLIDKNIKKYSSKNIGFKKGNIIKDPIPTCDLLIVRDCLFHFSYYDINRFLENIDKTNYKYLLTTSHVMSDDFKNHDIKTGNYRRIDLLKPPFNFRQDKILDTINDFPIGHDKPKNMFLIKKKYVPIGISLQ